MLFWCRKRKTNVWRDAGALLLIMMLIGAQFLFFRTPQTQADTVTWSFDTAGDYTYDGDKIEVTGGQAQLKVPADWYGASWPYRRPITVDNSSGGALTDFQVKVSVTYDSNMQADFDDLRFTNSNGLALLDHWRETYTASTSATFWVEIPSIPAAATTTIYVYYGNGAAVSASSGDDTFTFFDDFYCGSAVTLDTFNKIGLADAVNPVIAVGAVGASDRYIREIGNVLYEPSAPSAQYKIYYTGYNVGATTDEKIHYAYSSDGVTWTKSLSNPVISTRRAEDPYVLKVDSTYYLYAEDKEAGGDDKIRRWSSADGTTWVDEGQITGILDVQSPVVWKDGATWYLLYEQFPDGEQDIRLATSADGLAWTNSPANPVFSPADTDWATRAVVSDDIIYRDGVYHLLYHGQTSDSLWYEGIATSVNLTDWTDSANSQMTATPEITNLQTVSLFHDTQDVFMYYGDSDSKGIFRGYPVVSCAPDVSKWTEYKKGSSSAFLLQETDELILQGLPTVNSSANVRSLSTFTNDVVIEVRRKGEDSRYHHFSLGAGDPCDLSGGASLWYHTTLQSGYLWLISSDVYGEQYRVPASGAAVSVSGTFSPGSEASYRTHKYVYDASGNMKWYINDVQKLSVTNTAFLNDAKRILLTQGEYTNGWGDKQFLDWIFVRKFAATDPTASTGAEDVVYDTDNPSIQPKAAHAQAFSSLSGFAETATKNDGEIKYQISNDTGVTWYWWAGADWATTVAGYTEANTASEVNSHIATLPVGSGSFLFKGYLHSDGTQLVQLSAIDLTYTGGSSDPTISTLTPLNNAVNVSTTTNLVAVFNEAVYAQTGHLSLYNGDDTLVQAFDVTTDITGSGTTTITANPTSDLDEQTHYYVQIDATAFDDAAGNSFAGIADETTWNFTTADETNPTISTLTPLNNAVNVSTTTNLVAVFNEAVYAQTGDINLYKGDDTLVQAFDVTTDITGSGTTTITADPSLALAEQTHYYIKIDATAFDDAAGNSFAGIADETTWNFTTGGPYPPTILAISSSQPDGYYKAGAVIDIDLTFSEEVTSTGAVTVTLETGQTDRTCSFSVAAAETAGCDYIVQEGDGSENLDARVAGVIRDQAGNLLTDFVPAISLATSKKLVIDTTIPLLTSSLSSGTYTAAQTLSLDCNKTPCTIYYTLDGAIPDSSAPAYSQALEIGETATVKAIAYDRALNRSSELVLEIIIDTGGRSVPQNGLIVTAPESGGGPQIGVFKPDGTRWASFLAYDKALRGGFQVLTANLRNAEANEIITLPGAGLGAHLKVFNNRGALLAQTFAYGQSFRSGLNGINADINGDGKDEIIVAPLANGGPQVRVYRLEGRSLVLMASVMAYDRNFRGGLNLAALNSAETGRDYLLTIPSSGGTSQLKVWEYEAGGLAPVAQTAVFDVGFRGGATLAVGDLNGDGREDISVAPVSGSSHIRVYNFENRELRFLDGTFAYGESFRGGVNLAAGDINGDGRDELVTVPRSAGGPNLRVYDVSGNKLHLLDWQLVYDRFLTSGLNLSVADINNDGKAEIVTAPRRGGPNIRVYSYPASLYFQHWFWAYNPSFAGGVNLDIGRR